MPAKCWNETPVAYTPGAKAYFTIAGTTTPLVTYADGNLTTPHANPVVASAAGYFAAIYLPYTDYGVRITTSADVLIWQADNISNPAPPDAGGGGGIVVQASDIIQTGMIVWEPCASIPKTGYVIPNGLTIGNASSGATQRANSDTENLFIYLWDNMADALCPVSGGRGASAAADYAANKTIQLLDMRRAGVFGMSAMGNPGTAFNAAVPFVNGNGTTPGSRLGSDVHTLTEAQLAAHTHVATVSDPGHTHTSGSLAQNLGTPYNAGVAITAASQVSGAVNGATTGITVSNASTGSGAAHNNMPFGILGTWYQKL